MLPPVNRANPQRDAPVQSMFHRLLNSGSIGLTGLPSGSAPLRQSPLPPLLKPTLLPPQPQPSLRLIITLRGCFGLQAALRALSPPLQSAGGILVYTLTHCIVGSKALPPIRSQTLTLDMSDPNSASCVWNATVSITIPPNILAAAGAVPTFHNFPAAPPPSTAVPHTTNNNPAPANPSPTATPRVSNGQMNAPSSTSVAFASTGGSTAPPFGAPLGQGHGALAKGSTNSSSSLPRPPPTFGPNAPAPHPSAFPNPPAVPLMLRFEVSTGVIALKGAVVASHQAAAAHPAAHGAAAMGALGAGSIGSLGGGSVGGGAAGLGLAGESAAAAGAVAAGTHPRGPHAVGPPPDSPTLPLTISPPLSPGALASPSPTVAAGLRVPLTGPVVCGVALPAGTFDVELLQRPDPSAGWCGVALPRALSGGRGMPVLLARVDGAPV